MRGFSQVTTKRQITEYLDLELESETWCCHRCGKEIISARENYKKGCLVFERDPWTVHPPGDATHELSLAPNPKWCRIVEFYCPGCGAMIENEYLPPGHPITHDIELDIDAFKKRELGKT